MGWFSWLLGVTVFSVVGWHLFAGARSAYYSARLGWPEMDGVFGWVVCVGWWLRWRGGVLGSGRRELGSGHRDWDEGGGVGGVAATR